MTDTLKTIKQVREVVQKLTECRDFVINKQKKSELDRLIQELRLLEDSLLVKNPLTSIGLQAPTLGNGGMPSASRHAPSINQFRVMADQQGLNTLPKIQAAATLHGVNSQQASTSVMQMQQSRQRAEVEAWAANLLPDIRSKLYGRNMTPTEAQTEIKRMVQSSGIETSLVDSVANVVTAQILREAGIGI